MKKGLFAILFAIIIVVFIIAFKIIIQLAPLSADTNNTYGEIITIRVFSNQTDRTAGQGLIEQTLFDNYMEENKNVRIEVEALDDEAYKTKFKAYASGSEMPDLMNAWGQPSFINEVIDAGLLAELDPADYIEYGFIPGSLDKFMKNGKLYGLPRNTDIMVFYYNKALFEQNGWKVPDTYEDLLALADKFNSIGIIPCSMDGADKWPFIIFQHDLLVKLEGDFKEECSKSIETGDFSNPAYIRSAELLQEAVQAKLFQNGFESTDYGTSLNLFTNGQAAMYYMGSWEMSMAVRADILPEIRDNIDVFIMPMVKGGKGKVTDITAWNGGGYAIFENSKVKDEAIKLLNYMFKPENWSKLSWEKGVCMSAQKYYEYKAVNETQVQKTFANIILHTTSTSGVTLSDLGTSEFKTISEDAAQEMAVGFITPEQYIQILQDVCKKNKNSIN